MPNLVVYVSAATWRRIEEGFGPDGPAQMREVSRRAIEDLASSGAETARAASGPAPGNDYEEAAREVAGASQEPPALTDGKGDEVKPDFKGGRK